MKLFKSGIAGIAMFACATAANAGVSGFANFFSEQNAAVQKNFDYLSQDLGAALSYKAITPAEPLAGGILPFGVDIGVEASMVHVAHMSDWSKALGASNVFGSNNVPIGPKIHALIGIPFGIDFGAVYAPIIGTNVKYWGGEIRYSFLSGNVALPAIALRGAYTTVQGIKEWDFNNKSVELTISKGILMFTPYAGIGNVWTTSKLKYTADTTVGSTTIGDTLSFSSSPSQFKWFVGVNLNLGLVNLCVETDKTGASQSYSAKVGFRF